MISHKELKDKALSNPKVRQAYDGMEEEFQFLDELLQARKSLRLTQEEVAKRMGAKIPAIAKLESGAYSPTIDTLRKYAGAVGCKLEIKLIPKS